MILKSPAVSFSVPAGPGSRATTSIILGAIRVPGSGNPASAAYTYEEVLARLSIRAVSDVANTGARIEFDFLKKNGDPAIGGNANTPGSWVRTAGPDLFTAGAPQFWPNVIDLWQGADGVVFPPVRIALESQGIAGVVVLEALAHVATR